jgi:hypothetical protein
LRSLHALDAVRPGPFGGQRAGFSATAQINRRHFGIARWTAILAAMFAMSGLMKATQPAVVLDHQTSTNVPSQRCAAVGSRRQRLAPDRFGVFWMPKRGFDG